VKIARHVINYKVSANFWPYCKIQFFSERITKFHWCCEQTL